MARGLVPCSSCYGTAQVLPASCSCHPGDFHVCVLRPCPDCNAVGAVMR